MRNLHSCFISKGFHFNLPALFVLIGIMWACFEPGNTFWVELSHSFFSSMIRMWGLLIQSQAVASAHRTPPSALPSEGREMAGSILPSTTCAPSHFTTAENNIPCTLELCSHRGLEQGTVVMKPEPSLCYDYSLLCMVRVVLLSDVMYETCISMICCSIQISFPGNRFLHAIMRLI